MPKKSFITLSSLLLASTVLVGCGSVTSVTSPGTETDITPGLKSPTVVVMPFSDYSSGWTPDTYWTRNSALHEQIADKLKERAYRTAIDEDVVSYLVDSGVIKVSKQAPQQNSITNTFSGFRWSAPTTQNGRIQNTFDPKTDSIALTPAQLTKIGEKFDAKYIIRGRILEYSYEDTKSYNPFATGLVPFVLNTTSGSVFGTADSKNFEMLNSVATGAALGWGASAVFNGYDSWAAIGGGAAFLAQNSGNTDATALNVRLIAQDAKTGEVVWTNRAEVTSLRSSVFSTTTDRELFNDSVQVVVNELFKDFDHALETNQTYARPMLSVEKVSTDPTNQAFIAPAQETLDQRTMSLDAPDSASCTPNCDTADGEVVVEDHLDTASFQRVVPAGTTDTVLTAEDFQPTIVTVPSARPTQPDVPAISVDQKRVNRLSSPTYDIPHRLRGGYHSTHLPVQVKEEQY